MDTTSYLLPGLRLALCPVDLSFACAEPTLAAPAMVDIEYAYTPPPRGLVPTRPNGDPGDEPEEREGLIILRISAKVALHFADDALGVLTTLVAGCDLHDYLTDGALRLVELDVLKQVRAARDEARVDAYLDRQP